MKLRRSLLITAFLVALAFPVILTAQSGKKPDDNNFGFGKWKFTGKDKSGIVWTGTLKIEKLDPNMFDAKKYIAQGDLRIENADGGGKGANPPVAFDPASRIFTMGAESDYGGAVYTAVLSADGKSLTRGTWKETERLSDEKEKRVVSEGEWSATRIE